jgi:hypothetical protein
METIRISEAEAARDFAGVIARVRAVAEVVIESASAAKLRVVKPGYLRVHPLTWISHMEPKAVAPASSPAVLTASRPSGTSPDHEFLVVDPRVRNTGYRFARITISKKMKIGVNTNAA